VETGLVTALLSPLLLGLLAVGGTLWQLQGASEYEPRVRQSDLVGSYTSCAALLDAVRDSVLANLDNVSRAGGDPVQLDDIAAEVVDHVPGQVGVDVAVRVRVDAGGWAPFGGSTEVESRVHVAGARLDVQTC
jgi:hypothetical protein